MKDEAAKINVILGSHAHVPYGADTCVFEKKYTHLLLPFISTLYKYPKIQAVLHYSGVLLHWVERSHPELLMLIEDMVLRRQVELIGGGFYEPLFTIIPKQDKIGQIELLTTYIRKQFGKRPQGCWIPDFVWEQNLVDTLASCGMGFTFLSEYQFSIAGGKMFPCLCENQGKLITVFPVLNSFEQSLAKKSISAALLELSNGFSEKKEIIVTIFPNKIKTNENEANEVSWSRFFEELAFCENFTETITPGKLYKNLKGIQKLYIPDSSGLEDSIPSRRYIIMNAESGGIYSKMMFTNVLINQLKGDKSRKLSAREEIWKAQGSALFCSPGSQAKDSHSLRNAAYGALLGAERLAREKGKFTPSLTSYDINMDNTDEWLFQEAKINFYVQSLGGGIFELDYFPKAWNYLDTVNNRLAFADRFLPPKISGVDLINEKIPGGRFCFKEYYELQEMDKVRRKLTLMLYNASLPYGSVEIKKIFLQKKDAINTVYSITNRGDTQEHFQFAPMIDLNFPEEKNTRFFLCKSGTADLPLPDSVFPDTEGIKIHDLKNEVQITLTANRSFNGSIAPVYLTDSKNSLHFFQAYCIMPLFHVLLKPGETFDLEFMLKFFH